MYNFGYLQHIYPSTVNSVMVRPIPHSIQINWLESYWALKYMREDKWQKEREVPGNKKQEKRKGKEIE